MTNTTVPLADQLRALADRLEGPARVRKEFAVPYCNLFDAATALREADDRIRELETALRDAPPPRSDSYPIYVEWHKRTRELLK